MEGVAVTREAYEEAEAMAHDVLDHYLAAEARVRTCERDLERARQELESARARKLAKEVESLASRSRCGTRSSGDSTKCTGS